MPQQTTTHLPDRIPVLPIRSTVVFPMGATALQIAFEPNVEALLSVEGHEPMVAMAAVLGEAAAITPAALEKIGVLARVLDRLNLPGGTIQATLQGLSRIRLADVRFERGYYTARPVAVEETPLSEDEAEPLIERILTTVAAVAARVERIPDEAPRILRMNVTQPGRFADLVATLANLSVGARDDVLQELDQRRRLERVLEEVAEGWDRVREDPGAPHRQEPGAPAPEGIRRRIQALQAELGEVDPGEREAIDFLRRIDRAQLPQRVAAVARREVDRMRAIGPAAADAAEIRTYLDALLEVPWQARADGDLDLDAVRAAMDAEHVGLEDPKLRILEALAVSRLRGVCRGPIPCLVGPVGVGKRSLAAAVARGLNRPLARIPFPGRSEEQLAGTRRGRPGAETGRILSALIDAGACDPVILLEEVDEVGIGNVGGDPIEVLSELIDPERPEFHDRYLETGVNLSHAIFVATAGDFLRIPRGLRDRFVEIRLAGYTSEEKLEITRRVLLERLSEEHGLEAEEVAIDTPVLEQVIRGYARDAGLGGLVRALSAILRSLALEKSSGGSPDPIDRERVERVLGLPRYTATPAEERPEIGVVTGLAWTASGGELMLIEALKMPGKGRLVITGLLGDVMRESVNAAYSYVRSQADRLGIAREVFPEHDVHVHFPVGGIPKDGPSAGAAVTLAIASALSERPVRHDVAMTGEVTLRGRVLDIGGVKEKTLAAYRAGIREVILPRGNERDLRDVPTDVRDGVEFHLVDRMEEILALALLGGGAGSGAAQAGERSRHGGEREPRVAHGG
jgi:ATP-dependent Lon protease